MSLPQDFTCVFCNEAFEDKESLQEHFRKHGDPKFNSIVKNKGRAQNEQAGGGEKSEDGEMVGCDVCDEVFPSISKAITHKHKVHPDHDTKHFCPWCGKLFTMKHLYNKHMQSNHSDTPTTDENDVHYHCDSCVVDFFVVSAMVYHNKFFHRQDTELPSIGHSKKVKTYNQEMVQIYYCPFCGEEYNNKVNLHKHMGDDHSDENQSPEEVLRCPLCDAVFYHLDAYELHLSFHTSEDVYSDETEVSDITDFSLESVPPIMEKVEEETKNVENEGIDKFLQLIMDESRESGNADGNDRPKSKKHKKHKKSKKAAITLDEFLNMNKDVFGDGLDVQGIEEVPTQQVLKKYKGKKDNVKPIPASALAKLKKQGITVKSNSGIKSPILKTNRNLTVNTAKIMPNRIPHIIQEKPKPVATSNELLTKLLNQGNSQIKIIKKSTSEKPSTDNIFSQSDQQEPNSSANINPVVSDTEESKLDEMAQDTGNMQSEDIPNDKEAINNDNIINNTEMECGLDDDQTVNKENNHNKKVSDDNVSKTDNSEQVKSYNNSPDTIQNTCENKADMESSDRDDSYETTEDTETKTSDDEEIPHKTQSTSSNAHYQVENIKKIQSSNKSLDALKHLSGLITVKSTSNAEDKSNITESTQVPTDNDDEEMDDDSSLNISKITPKNIQNMTIKKPQAPQIKPDIPAKSIDSFKNLSKQLTIKPCISPSSSSKCDEPSDGEEESDNYESHDNTPVQNTNDNGCFKTPMSVTKQPNTSLKHNNSYPSDIKRPIQVRTAAKEVSKEEDTKKTFNMDILKRLTNVTAKPVVKATNNLQTTGTSNQSPNSPKPFIAKLEKNKQIDQEIEIFNIDDSDSDQETNEESLPKQIPNLPKSYETTPVKTATPVNVLKNLGKNITVKPSNSPNKNVLNIKKEVQGESSRISSDRNIRSPGSNDAKINTQTKQMNMTLNHTLKKLGNNISIKSQFSSTDSQKYQMEHDEDMDDHFDMNDEESDPESSNKVKITEVQEDEDLPSDTDMEYNENVIVQSPHASHSENEEEHNSHSDDEINEDLERQIKMNTLPKMNSASTCLDNFKRNNRELTIKSLSDKTADFPQVGSPGNKKEEPTRIAKNVPKDTSNKQFREAERNEENEVSTKNVNQSVASSSSSQKVTNQVNTVKTVKTFQSETVIEEITTTVTKTIRTVNQSSKQVAQNANVGTPRPRLKAPIQQGKPLRGMTVRNAQTVGTKIRCAAPRPTIAVPARPTGQLVPVRPQNQMVPRQGIFRAATPGPSNVRKMSPQLNIQKPVIGKPLKISPLAMNQSVKRPSEDMSGHFSCFKKPKDAVMPQMDAFDDDFGDDSAVNYSSASSSRSDFSTTATKVVKGKSVVTAMQARSEQHSEQHITKLNNMSGLKVVRTSAKQATVETRNDMSAANRTAMDAIERLQKQGLLIKKPRVETPEENEQYHSDEDDDDYEEK